MLPMGVTSENLKSKERTYLLMPIAPHLFPFVSQTQLHEKPCAWVAQGGVPLSERIADISMAAFESDAFQRLNVTG